METDSTVEQKNEDMNRRFMDIYTNQYKDFSNRFDFSQNLNDIENDELGKAHSQYMMLKNRIRNAKNRLGEQMDLLYNNFVMPARNHHLI